MSKYQEILPYRRCVLRHCPADGLLASLRGGIFRPYEIIKGTQRFTCRFLDFSWVCVSLVCVVLVVLVFSWSNHRL